MNFGVTKMADGMIAMVDKTRERIAAETSEPFHPEQCGPCWFCRRDF